MTNSSATTTKARKPRAAKAKATAPAAVEVKTVNGPRMTRTYTFHGRAGEAHLATYGTEGDTMRAAKCAFLDLGEALDMEFSTAKADMEQNPDRTSGFADIAVLESTAQRFVAIVTVRYQVTEHSHFSFLSHEPIALTGSVVKYQDQDGLNYFELLQIPG